jgi:single-stranded DNA-specific DHH superfamily exonuclease
VSSLRARAILAQALGRVGRYSDYAQRFKLLGMEFIDDDLKAKYIDGLHEEHKESQKQRVRLPSQMRYTRSTSTVARAGNRHESIT